jgi:hypothetical protein
LEALQGTTTLLQRAGLSPWYGCKGASSCLVGQLCLSSWRSPTYREFCGVCLCLIIARCNIPDRGLGYCPDHLLWLWSSPLLGFKFVEQHLVRVGRFPFALKLDPHRLCPPTGRTAYSVAILLPFNLRQILVFCIVGNPRIGLNRYSDNAVAICNLSFHNYSVNYCTSVRLGTIAS